MNRHHLMVVLTILLVIIMGSVSMFVQPSARCHTDTDCMCTNDCLDSAEE